MIPFVVGLTTTLLIAVIVFGILRVVKGRRIRDQTKRFGSWAGNNPILCSVLFAIGFSLAPISGFINHPTATTGIFIGAGVVFGIIMGMIVSTANRSGR